MWSQHNKYRQKKMKIISNYLNRFLIVVLLLIPFFSYSQKGSIKIFSEIKGIDVFLDDLAKGTDVLSIDSVNTGSHYLKILKDNATVYSELINVKTNEVTTILVKKSQDNQMNMDDLIKLYKTQRIDVMLNLKYFKGPINTTNEEFPHFSLVNETSQIDTSSLKDKTKDWFFALGGEKELSDYEFALIINDQDLAYNIQYARYTKRTNRIIGWTLFSTGAVIIGVGIYYLMANTPANITPAKQLQNGEIIIANGLVPLTGGLYMAGKLVPRVLTLHEAIKLVNNYNQSLRKRLGIPENIEIK
jgi:hypothetical protein